MKAIPAVLAGAVLFGAVAGVTASTATAEPLAEHAVGDQCMGADIGRKDIAPNGQPIICDSNYTWEPNVGQVPNDPWVTAQH